MASINKFVDYSKVIQNDESLKLFLQKVGEFDGSFCDHMANGDDFTISLEVRGCKGKIIHCLVKHSGYTRPSEVDENEEWRHRGVDRSK